jgi:signal transduction histidine kinase
LQALFGFPNGQVCGDYEVEVALPEGNVVTLHVTPSSLMSPAVGEVRVVHDVTLEREAADARALFISQVSHELRTPLQHIMSFASILSDIDDLPLEESARFVSHIQDETDHMARLVSDLLELSRIETGHFSVYVEPVQLDALVADVASKLRPRARSHDLELILENLPEPLLVQSDSIRLEQVLGNLIENAIKFVPGGGTITVSATYHVSHVVLRVTDTGPGIAPDALPHIFESYYQARARHPRRNTGIGLGLFISHEIIAALGGAIWAESELGTGTTFSISLPCSSE